MERQQKSTQSQPFLMVDFDYPDGIPSIAEVRLEFGLAPTEVDEDFGVLQLEPDQHPNTFTIQVAPRAVSKVLGQESTGDSYESVLPGQVSSDPRIVPFGTTKD